MAYVTDGLPKPSTFEHRVGVAAHVSGVAAVLGLVTLATYFVFGQPWGTINDFVAIVLGLSIFPVAAGVHRWLQASGAEYSEVVFALGVLGGLSLIAASIAVLAATYGVVGIDLNTLLQTTSVASGIVGLWLLGVVAVGAAHDAFRRRLTWPAFAAGIGYIGITVGFWLGGATHPLTLGGGLVAVIGYAAWTFLLGIRFGTGTAPLN